MAGELAAWKIHACEETIDYVFKDKEKLGKILQVSRSSREVEHDGMGRMAVVGDRVLGLVLAEEWHAGDEPRVTWARISSTVGSNTHLARVCKHHGLDNFVTCDPTLPKVKLGKMKQATLVEAIIGAAYQDGGLPAARMVMTSLGLFGHKGGIMITTDKQGSPPDLMMFSTDEDMDDLDSLSSG